MSEWPVARASDRATIDTLVDQYRRALEHIYQIAYLQGSIDASDVIEPEDPSHESPPQSADGAIPGVVPPTTPSTAGGDQNYIAADEHIWIMDELRALGISEKRFCNVARCDSVAKLPGHKWTRARQWLAAQREKAKS